MFTWLRNWLGGVVGTQDWDANEIGDLTGFTAVVTGASSGGIGFEVAKELYLHGAHVYLACRSESKAVASVSSIEASPRTSLFAHGRLSFLPFDLTDLKSCRKAANFLLLTEARLDILVANAGVMGDPYELIDGIELQFYNHLGHHAFIVPLLPLLTKTAAVKQPNELPVRVVVVTSNAHDWSPPPSFASLSATINNPSNSPFARYGLSKLCNLLFCLSLSSRLALDLLPASPTPTPSRTLSVLAVHPGPVSTNLPRGTLKSYPWLRVPLEWVVPLFLLTPEEGARTVLFAAAASEADGRGRLVSGTYLVPYAQVAQPSKTARDDKLAGELWELSERLIKERVGPW